MEKNVDPADNVWEQHYRNNDMPWDKGVPSPGLMEFLAENPVRGSVLVPGCGTGHDVRAFAAQGAEVRGMDLAPAGVEAAQRFPKAGNERYRVGDFLNPPPEWRERFDWVFEHTLFCAIDPSRRHDYFRSVVRLLKPGGHYLAVFYMNPEHRGDGPPYGVTRAELDHLFQPPLALRREWIPGENYPSRTGREMIRLYRRS